MEKTGIHENNALGTVARHIQAVIQGMLFLGFTVQIILGILWMCGNFAEGQSFGWHNLGRADSGEAEFALYRSLYDFIGQWPGILYLLQLALAFLAGYVFLRRHVGKKTSEGKGWKRAFTAWGSLALLTFPFAMQCHLAVLPYSAMASFFLLMLSFLLELAGGKRDADVSEEMDAGKRDAGVSEEMDAGKRGVSVSKETDAGKKQAGKQPAEKKPAKIKSTEKNPSGKQRAGKWKSCVCAVVCGALAVTLSGAVNTDERQAIWGRGIQAALASRIAWPNIWNDYDYWPQDLREITEKALRETSYYPGNMEIMLQAIEDAAGPDKAKDYYMQIAKIGWDNRAYMVVRQIGWDLLGYGMTPSIFRLQLEGRAYDSYTGRNYEIMQEHTPVLTRYYVDYGCWWFGCSLILAALWAAAHVAGKGIGSLDRKQLKRRLVQVCICIAAAGIPVMLYTMRGAGLMDYRCTVGINELWLVLGLSCVRSCGK